MVSVIVFLFPVVCLLWFSVCCGLAAMICWDHGFVCLGVLLMSSALISFDFFGLGFVKPHCGLN